jgi:peptidoglycan/xylan/chitin deacetylase (PgdA/CDA1 family)
VGHLRPRLHDPISDDLFTETVRFLKRHYSVVTLDQVLAARRGAGRLPPRPLLITFDDGWSDNVDYALPALRREGVPAVLFVVADAVGSRRPFFQEQLVIAWRAGKLSADDVRAIAVAAGATGQPPADGMPAVRHAIAALEALSAEDRDRVLAPYADRLDDGVRHMVTAPELGELERGGVAIGMHGKTHTPLTRAANLHAELDDARRAVAGHLAAPPDKIVTVSFPHGKWTPEVLDRARQAGYELMFTSVKGMNALDPSCSDVLARLGIETDSSQDRSGRFRPDWLALQLFRQPVKRLP